MWLDDMCKIVSSVPAGKVVSYGQVSARMGSPRSSRMVGWGLGRLPYDTKVPWHRVVNRFGELTIVHPFIKASSQAELLKKEGVEVKLTGDLYKVDLKKFGYNFFE